MFGLTKGYQAWATKQAGKPKLLVISAICFTASFYIGYRCFVTPYVKKRRYTDAEEYANKIYASELIKKA